MAKSKSKSKNVQNDSIPNDSEPTNDPITYASKEEEEDFLNFSEDDNSTNNTDTEDTFKHAPKAYDVAMSDDDSECESDDKMSVDSDIEVNEEFENEESDTDQPFDRKASRELGKVYSEQNKRTLFVGNITPRVTKKVLIQLFNSKKGAGEGAVETIRIRGAVAPGEISNSRAKRKAVIQKTFANADNQILCAFVVLKKEEDVEKCLVLNGHVIDGKHIRVDKVKGKKMSFIPANCIFIGNLPYTVNEEVLRESFIKCGEIVNIRLVRNKHDGKVIGIGYIEFTEALAVDFALKLNGSLKIEDRVVRIQKWSPAKTQKEMRKNKPEPKKSFKLKVVAPSNLKGIELKEYVKNKKKKLGKKKERMNKFIKSKQNKQANK